MSRPRAASNRRLPDNLYRRLDGRLYFRDPRTGKTHSLGRDLGSAVAQAVEVNIQLQDLRARARLTHRLNGGGATLAAWLDEYGQALAADETLSVGTRRIYRGMSGLLAGAMGSRVMAEMTPADVSEG